MTDKSIPASKIPEGELWDIPWVCRCKWDDKLYIYTPAKMWGLPWVSDCNVCQPWQDVHEALHPYWPPGHDFGTLDQMPEGEVVKALSLCGRLKDVYRSGDTVLRGNGSLISHLPHDYRVISRPNYDPRVGVSDGK